MLAKTSYPKDHIDTCRARTEAQLSAFAKLRKEAGDAVETLEPEFFNNLVVVLDHQFVHRARGAEGKDGNPINEVRVISDSLTEHDGEMTAQSSIKLKPENSVLGIEPGARIRIGEDDFRKLADAYYAEIEKRFG